MGGATFLVGCLPTYSAIGIWAPILVATLRLLQGLAIGGEWSGAVLMATEHSPSHRRGFYGSWPQMGAPTGLLLASLLFSIISSSLSQHDFLAFGWRIPFLLSILLVFVGLFIRLKITETPDFEHMKKTQTMARIPLADLLGQRRNLKYVILGAGVLIGLNTTYSIYTTFSISYGTTILKIPSSVILNAVQFGSIVLFLVLPLTGTLSDRIGRLPLYLIGAGLTILMVFPIFWLIDTKSPILITLAMCLGMGIGGLIFGPSAAFYSEMFGANVRYSGTSLSYQSSAIIGGLAPFIATVLLGIFGPVSWPLAVYIIVTMIITFVSAILAGETRKTAVMTTEASVVGE